MIIKAYKESWNNLVNEYLSGNFNDDGKHVPDDLINDTKYERNLTKGLYPVLFEFIKEAANKSGNKFKIGRGIVQINSIKKKRRIRIPVNGNIDIDTQYDYWKKIIQDKWMNRYFDLQETLNHDKGLMYLQPDEPNHLLTELMWRMQPARGNNVEKETCAFIVLKENCEGYEMLKESISNNDNNIKGIILAKNSLDKDNLKLTTSELNKNRLKNPKVKLADPYSQDHCNDLLAFPRQILFENVFESGQVSNIIYISDINETNYLGAFDFELIDEHCNSEISQVDYEEKLVNFLRDLRWNMSKYIIELLSNTERNYASSGKIYKDLYFEKENNEYPALQGFIDYLDIEKYPFLSNSTILVAVFKKIRNHFILADSDIGEYWRGYNRHAFEVACTVAGLIDILFPLNGQISLEKIVRSSGPDFEKFGENIDENDKNNKIPFLFKQLFNGLQGEKELFLLPYYRDHFIHSFYCFSFGLLLMTLAPKKLIKSSLQLKYKPKDDKEKFIMQWFVVSMWHDIAYVLEKGHGIIEKYVLKFVKENKRFKNVIPFFPALGNLLQIENLLDEVRQLSFNSIESNSKKLKIIDSKSGNESQINEIDLIIAVAFDEIDHGIWSSLFVYHGAYNDENLNKYLA